MHSFSVELLNYSKCTLQFDEGSRTHASHDNENEVTGSSVTADTRQRVDSLNQQPQARPHSYIDDTEAHRISRADSVASARPPSIIEEAEFQNGAGILVSTLLDPY